MRAIFSYIFFTTIALLLLARFYEGIQVASITSAIIASIGIGLVNAVIRPVVSLLTLPLTILTLGLFRLVINGLLLYLVAYYIDGFRIEGFITAVWASVAISLMNYILDLLVRKK